MAEKFITEEQRAKCRKVAEAFAELYELQNNQPMHQVQEEFLKAEMEKIWEESLCGPLS